MAQKNYRKRKSGWIWITGAFVIVLLFLLVRPGKEPANLGGEYLTPVDSINDVHGLAVDIADSSKVWIASHTGLHLLKDDKDLFVVGEDRDDYMGFSVHASDPNIFFASGHPTSGGNLGFQQTTDGGRSWQKVGNGAGFRPVDFHTLAVGMVDPNIIYGSSGGLQRSTDGGKNWEKVDSAVNNYQIISLATDPKEKDTVYAATDRTGILVSRDQGKLWTKLSEVLSNDAVSAIAINPTNNQELIIYSQGQGLAGSTDGGQNWSKITAPWASSAVLYISYDKNKPSTVYAINQALEIYKSTDATATWSRVK